MINKKIAASLLGYILLFYSLLINLTYSESTLVINTANSTGDWNKGIVTYREVVFTNKPLIKSEINAYIENPGKYQLFAYIHHNWRKAVPCIYVEAVDSKGIKHEGSHRIENLWYLNQDCPGRWFMVSLAGNPYWELPTGNLAIRFWADAEKSPWDNTKAAMESKISASVFFLIPVEELKERQLLSYVISPEVARGNWDKIEYDFKHATNLIKSTKKGDTVFVSAGIPKSGYYKILSSLFSEADNSLEIMLQSDTKKQDINIQSKGAEQWREALSESVYLEQGAYKLTVRHDNANPLLIDYLMILPYSRLEKK